MVTFLNILVNPLIGLSPLAASEVALGETSRQQLHVFRTGIDCSSVGAEMIQLEQALVAYDPDAGRLINDVASGLSDLRNHHPQEYEAAVDRVKIFSTGPYRGDPIALNPFGDPLDVFIKISEGGTPIRFRRVKDIAIEEKLLFASEGRASPFTLMSPEEKELFRFYPPYVEAGALLFIGEQEHREPIQISSILPVGIPLAMEIILKGANGSGPHFVVTTRGKERPKIDRDDGLPNIGYGGQNLTPGDQLHIGEGYKLRLEPAEAAALPLAEELGAEATRIAAAAVEEPEVEESEVEELELERKRAENRFPSLALYSPALSLGAASDRRPDSLARLAIGIHFGKLAPYELKPGEEIVLGRDPRQTGRYGIIPDPSGYISRKHVKIIRGSDGNFWIEDLESRNGTAVNGEWLAPYQRVRLLRGDFVKLGRRGETFIFDYWMEEEPRRTTVTSPSTSSPSLARGLPAPPPASEPRVWTPVPLPTIPPTFVYVSVPASEDIWTPFSFAFFGRWLEKLRRLLHF